MDVRDIDEFMEDVDEYEIRDVETIEYDDRERVRAVKVTMFKPIAEVEAELYIDAYYKKESQPDFIAPARGALSIEPAEWYVLDYHPDRQGADQDAVMRLYKLIYESKIDFREVLDKAYEINVVRGK